MEIHKQTINIIKKIEQLDKQIVDHEQKKTIDIKMSKKS